MAFLKKYKYDLFITYRRADNPDTAPWVTRFHEHLDVLMNPSGVTAPESSVRIFRDDSQIRGNHSLPETLRDAASNSALLVVVMSRRYARHDSPWCETERKLFAESNRDKPNSDGRVFVVNTERVPNAEWPMQFRKSKGYDFWITDSRIAIPMPLDFRATATYPGIFRQLVEDMLGTLKQLLPDRTEWKYQPVSGTNESHISRVSEKHWVEKHIGSESGIPLELVDQLPDYVELVRTDNTHGLRLFDNHSEIRDGDNGWRYYRNGNWNEDRTVRST